MPEAKPLLVALWGEYGVLAPVLIGREADGAVVAAAKLDVGVLS